ncbi:hypothetical protein [Mycobacterium malmoense]|uniref:hypothetical protein n=1 Tax=Mycobacterium malmoense TaxID=1780 RepID=UPI0011476017|nr:hypothetical protein [Mycobacterium malmoense]
MKHSCLRCGFQSGHDAWWDRHPWPAALAAVPLLVFLAGAVLAYPWVLVPLLVVAVGVWVDWRQRQRNAVAARADWDYRQHMAALAWNGHGGEQR